MGFELSRFVCPEALDAFRSANWGFISSEARVRVSGNTLRGILGAGRRGKVPPVKRGHAGKDKSRETLAALGNSRESQWIRRD